MNVVFEMPNLVKDERHIEGNDPKIIRLALSFRGVQNEFDDVLIGIDACIFCLETPASSKPEDFGNRAYREKLLG